MPWQVYNSAGQLLQATDLVDGTVTASKLDTNAVTNAKVADDAIGVAELSASGTASNSTFLRGDNAWAAATATAPVFGRVKRTSANVTTTSTSLADFTGATVTLTTGAYPVRYSATQSGNNNGAGNSLAFNVDIDGSLELGTQGLLLDVAVVGEWSNFCFTGQSAALSAASHTIKLKWRVSAGTGTVLASSGNAHIWAVEEIR